MRSLLVPAAAGLILSASPALADGFYLSLHGGALFIPDTLVNFEPATLAEFTTDTGYRLGGALGMDFNDNFGGELEVSYGSVGVTGFSIVGGGGPFPATGDARLLSVMGNLVINLGNPAGKIRPYAGVGAGGVRLSLDNIDIGGGDGVNDDDWTWGAQAFFGADIAVSQNVSVGARYRFQYVGETNFEDFDGDPVSIDHVTAHSIEGVIKIRFNGL
jgi:opacity protein-like surface antigen